MKASDELRNLVESLTIGEKRAIKQLAEARSRAKGSQQLELLEMLDGKTEQMRITPKQHFGANYPIVSNRLKSLILDGLHFLHKSSNLDLRIHSDIAAIALLLKKRQYSATLRQLKRTKKQALIGSRYEHALLCIHWERKLQYARKQVGMTEKLTELYEAGEAIQAKQRDLTRLQYCHDMLRAHARQILAPRNPELMLQIAQFANDTVVAKYQSQGPYLENALAINTLGIHSLLERDSLKALDNYKTLLINWQKQPEWQLDQEGLVLVICSYYQIACFTSPIKWEVAKAHLALLQEFKAFSPDVDRSFQRMLHLNQFTLALNTGNFDSVKTLVPEISAWLSAQDAYLSEVQKLPFLHNFAVAEFLAGNNSAANQFVLRILNMPGRTTRKDIREFALVMQAVLQFELGNTELNEYLTRSGKRYFAKKSHEMVFELAVFRCLQKVSLTNSKENNQAALLDLHNELEQLQASLTGTMPVLGLMEMQLWAKSKLEGIPLKQLFLQVVHENLEAMGWSAKTHSQ